ncbi:hypothetical protein [Teredinibacter turnerae]|uniref:hypothetical protein n=1 Tax=Teredinibacter turnerae TaxID=2426 RepID=UPI00035C857F|nr:hypothetical protein [Teredinibacter turnerae]
MKIILSIVTLLISFNSLAKDLPPIIEQGFEQYRANGSKEAIIAWIKDSSIENNQDAIAQSNQLNYIEDFFGPYEGYDLFKSNSLGERSNLYLVTINYGKGVVYAKFFTYKTKSGKEVMQTFNFNTEVDKVWPSFMVYAQ